MWGSWKEESVSETSSIRPVVLTQYRLVADRRTHDGSIHRAGIAWRIKEEIAICYLGEQTRMGPRNHVLDGMLIGVTW